MDKGKEVLPLYKSQEKKLIWLSFGVAIIMLLLFLEEYLEVKGGANEMINESAVYWSRALTELTLSFHIIYATIGVGVPLMIMIAQWTGYKKNDEHYILMARRWAVVSSLL